MKEDYTLAVTDTNQEALASKISAIRKGYFSDPFAEEFAPFKGNRDIIMHRGYWARVHLVKQLTETFLSNSKNEPVQIVSLGGGLETLWFNLMSDEQFKNQQFVFVELDLQCVVKRKIQKIQKSKLITGLINKLDLADKKQVAQNQSYLIYGDRYKLATCDLSDLAEVEAVTSKLKLSPDVPTFFYCECVLSYIDSDAVDRLLKYITNTYSLCWLFDYEMYNPNDRFGKMMVQNFEMRGCPLTGIYKYPNLEDQRTRFQITGFHENSIELDTMKNIYYDYIDKAERLKIEKIEMLDEFEEWNIIMGHYFGILAHSSKRVAEKDSQKMLVEKMHMKYNQ